MSKQKTLKGSFSLCGKGLHNALCSDVLFSDPGLFFVVPDVDITEQVSVDYFVGSLPVALSLIHI